MLPKKRVIAHDQLIRLKQHLKRGGVCAYPTEFCYGLGALPHHRVAIKKILKLKKRPASKGLIVLAGQQSQVIPLLAPLGDQQKEAMRYYWGKEGANTLVLPANHRILPQLRGTRHKNLAVRVTHHQASAWLSLQLNTALVSTSANSAKAKPIQDIRRLKKQFGHKLWIVDAPLGKNKSPSKIIDLVDGKVLRGA